MCKDTCVLNTTTPLTGPHHFTSNTGVPLGVTIARRLCLAARGWRVVSLGHVEWERAVTPEDREELLRGVCEEAGADGPSMGG
jgi:hypothetical protein